MKEIKEKLKELNNDVDKLEELINKECLAISDKLKNKNFRIMKGKYRGRLAEASSHLEVFYSPYSPRFSAHFEIWNKALTNTIAGVHRLNIEELESID